MGGGVEGERGAIDNPIQNRGKTDKEFVLT